MNELLASKEQVWIPAERIGQIEVREYVHGDQARHTISISEADLKLLSLVGGFIARNPDNHADQWYIARDYFNKHYRIPVENKEQVYGPVIYGTMTARNPNDVTQVLWVETGSWVAKEDFNRLRESHGKYEAWAESCEPAPDSIRAVFKNFHRLLCERFGYVHDPKDWERDQLSLIEHIAKRGAVETPAEPCSACIEAHELINATNRGIPSGDIADRVGDLIETLRCAEDAAEERAGSALKTSGKHQPSAFDQVSPPLWEEPT